LLISAPTPERVEALVGLTRPGLDYEFFQLLSQRIEVAQAEPKTRLGLLREQLLDLTQRIDRAQEARTAQAAGLLRSLIQAPNLDQALESALPAVDDLFLGILGANLRAARDRGDGPTLARLQEIESRLRSLIQESLPPGLRLAQQLLDLEDEQQIAALLEKEDESIDEELLNALMGAAQRLEQAGDKEGADRAMRLHRMALAASMKRKLQSK
jgi:hypothetical protein